MQGNRIETLDRVRGVALLGILVMNIQAFSMPGVAYLNPHLFGSMEGPDGLVWLLSHVFADSKFIALFSILFGAGVALMAEKARAAGHSAVALHYRRTLVLGVIGAAHGFLIWYGDILFVYALCALLVYLFLRFRPRTLLIVGGLAYLLPVLLGIFSYATFEHWPEAAREDMRMAIWSPDSPWTEAQLAAYVGTWSEQQAQRFEDFTLYLVNVLPWQMFWQTGGLMLIGMALYRTGVLSGLKSARFYGWLAAAGLAVGLPIIILGVQQREAVGWAFAWTYFVGGQFNYIAAPLVALAYMSLVVLTCKLLRTGLLGRALEAVGRTALSNYLLQSVICTGLFYGFGLGLFGQVPRTGQLGVVILIWGFQLALSTWWVQRFHYGPVEWLWRAAARLQRPPMRKQPSPT